MQIETQTLSDFLPRVEIVEAPKDDEPSVENSEWLLPRQMQELVLWPRVLPGL